MIDYLETKTISKAETIENGYKLTILPFNYKDGRNPRLPRKRSDNYNLMVDTKFIFEYTFSELAELPDFNNKFTVSILITCGKDRLGTADLDNYSKAILDGVTHTQKIWGDDKQVDQLIIERKYDSLNQSKIELKISKLIP